MMVAGLGTAGPAGADSLAFPPSPPPRLGACGTGGGFLLPGTDGCLTIGGFVRAEGVWRSLPATMAFVTPEAGTAIPVVRRGADLGRSALGATAGLTADLRIPTELGPFRVFVSLRGHNGPATGRTAR